MHEEFDRPGPKGPASPSIVVSEVAPDGPLALHCNQQDWPRTCRYFDRKTMNAAAIDQILHDKTKYHKESYAGMITVVEHSQERTIQWSRQMAASSITERLKRLNIEGEQGPTISCVVFVGQKRMYVDHGTTNRIFATKDEWIALLSSTDVLPTFLQIINTDDSGYSHLLTYDALLEDQDTTAPRALHFMLKVGDYVGNEVALYARQDLRTGRAFVVFVGQENFTASMLKLRMQGAGELNVFHILVMFLEIIHDNMDALEWDCDLATRKLEGRTGYASFGDGGRPTVAKSDLDFSKDLQVSANHIRMVLWGCRRYTEILLFLRRQLVDYYKLIQSMHGPRLSKVEYEALAGALEHLHSMFVGKCYQLEELLHRVQAQMDVTRSLVAERDAAVTIEIAKDTKKDSEAMRGIAAVTMVFLPATFAATFFSMVFFHVGDESTVRLTVDKKFWLYPLVTVPLTLFIGWTYLRWSIAETLEWFRLDKLSDWWNLSKRSTSRSHR